MPADVRKTQNFIAQIKSKIDGLLAEFANGKLNRDQFHAVYEHYSNQLRIAEQALSSNEEMLEPGAPMTIAIMEAHMGKALAVVIYNNRSGTLVDTLGEFDVPSKRVASILNDFTMHIEHGQMPQPRVEKFTSTRWLLFIGGQYTTIVTLFKNEPSPNQAREMERLHRDFEAANQPLLRQSQFDASRLAYPFLVFIQRKLKQ
ncbi:MAG: hypothetical protein HXY40_14075 [Chloroflexi bacterium]|nr:hypothetical protein [Chloroflexota bacterium]